MDNWISEALRHIGPPRQKKGAAQDDGDDDHHAGADNGEAPRGFSWPDTQAYAASKSSASLQRELLSKAVITHFIEWCEAPCPALPGVAFHDICFRFDTPEGPLKQVRKSPSNHIYLCLPHKIVRPDFSDDAIVIADKPLQNFISFTFWRNEEPPAGVRATGVYSLIGEFAHDTNMSFSHPPKAVARYLWRANM